MVKLDDVSKEIIKEEEEIIQQILYSLDNRWSTERKYAMALAIYLKRGDNFKLIHDE